MLRREKTTVSSNNLPVSLKDYTIKWCSVPAGMRKVPISPQIYTLKISLRFKSSWVMYKQQQQNPKKKKSVIDETT